MTRPSMAPSLSESQLDRLSKLFSDLVGAVTFREPSVGESEPVYTGSVILPTVERWLPGLRKPALFVRGDGGVAPRPVYFHGASFYPDLEVAHFEQRCLAVEVKFLRDSDPTGSIAKAVGQGSIYLQSGVGRVHVLLVDCRTRRVSTPMTTILSRIVVHHRPAFRGQVANKKG